MARKRNVVRVVPDRGQAWNVKKDGEKISHHRKKERAINQGRRIARQDLPSQLVVHKQNGQIQTEYTYRDDPHPPDG
jgi:hypothetical protein